MSTPATRAAERIKTDAVADGRVKTHRQPEPPVIYGLTYEQRRAAALRNPERTPKRAFHLIDGTRQ